jgi:integration host factor subunit alpha
VTTSTTRAPARRLFRIRREAPEIHVRRSGEIGKDRPHCDCLVELLRVYLVERIVGAVVGVETIKPVLAQRYHWHAGFLQFADILPAGKGWPATMSGKTVTRADLCEAVCQKVRVSRTKSATLVELVLKEITDCLERGETVKLSSFGLFVVRKKGQRMGRNPRTGQEAPISPRRVVVFKPSAILKQRINAAPASEGLEE